MPVSADKMPINIRIKGLSKQETLIQVDFKSGTIINFEMLEPEDDAIVMLAEILIGFIFQFAQGKAIAGAG